MVPNIAEMASDKSGTYPFGINPKNAAAALRLLADNLDAGAILPQEMKDFSKAAVGDYTLRSVTLSFSTKAEAGAGS